MSRNRSPRWLSTAILLALLLGLVLPAQAAPARLDPRLVEYLANAPDGQDSFLVLLKDQADLRGAPLLLDRTARVSYVYEALRDTAERSQAGLRADLAAWGVPYHPFVIVNAIQVTGDLALARRLADRPEVARLVPDPSFNGLDDPPGSPLAPPAVDAVEWNIARLNADDVWALGYTGQGIVVGSVDTGVQYDHPALVNQYRGNLGGGSYDHNYNWGEPFGTSTAPYDPNGHGTHTTGTMVGDDGAGNQVGMAPGAQWIGCKADANGSWKASKYIGCWEWMLAPTDLNGQNPRPDLAAHVVNNSWSCPGSEGCDMDTLLPAAQSLYAAGIAIAKSGGNTGSGCGSITNPGQYTELLAAAAFNSSDTIAGFSSRGPVTYDGELRIKPDIAAPGVGIRSAYPGGGYSSLQGTSMASPHTAGLIALLWSARPALVGDLAATYQAVRSSAEPKIDLQCAPNGPAGRPNNVWGWGILDALAAVQAGGGLGALHGTAYDDAFTPLPGALVEIVQADNHLRRTTVTDANGNYAFTVLAATYAITATRYGCFPGTGTGVVVAPGSSVLYDLVLPWAPVHALSGDVTAATTGMPLPATLTLLGTPVSVPTDPATGFYTTTAAAGLYTLRAASPGYLPQERTITVTANLVEDFALQPEPAYALRDSTQPCGPAFHWIEISGSGQPWNLGDDAHAAVPLPRPFTFYGQPYSELFVGSNGQATFSPTGSHFPGGNTIPDPFLPNNAIYAFWDDLNPANGSRGVIYTQLVDGRYFVVEYHQVQHFPSGNPETFEIVLDMDTGVILLQYLVVNDTSRTTVGVENSTGTAGLSYAFHNPAWPTATQALAWVPHAGAYPVAQGPGLLRGTVVATGTLTPIPGAAVTARDWSGAYTATTDAAGAYTLSLCAGLYTVTAAAVGYSPSLPVPAAVYSGTTTVGDFFLERLPSCDPARWADFEWTPYWPGAGRPATFNGWSNNWSRETVDPGYKTGQLSSLALDNLDQPHIAYYYTGDSSVLAYARFDGTAWITAVVAPVGHSDDWECMANPLALDAAGRPHIAYSDWVQHGGVLLRYAYSDGLTWTIATLDYGCSPALVLDDADHPHIAYYEVLEPALTYAWFDGTAWFSETVESRRTGFLGTALGLDAAGNPHISYYDVMSETLRYAHYDSGWHVETVDHARQAAPTIYTSLALDAAGRPHIVYHDGSAYALRYARFDGTSWITETVVGDLFAAIGSLALDAAGRPHIAYNSDGYEPKYTFYDGTAWHVETVDHRAWTGYWSSLVLDSAETPRISSMAYGHGDAYGLIYATRLGDGPTPPITYTWDLGDGTLVLGPSSITHTYAQPGAYTVVMTATNCATATATAVHTVTVVGVPRIVLPPAIPTITLEPGQQVTYSFTIVSTGTADLAWSLAELPDAPWLAENPVAGTLGPGDSVEVLLTYTAPLTTGVYTTVLRITSNDPLNPAVDLLVEMDVFEACVPVSYTGFAWTPITPSVGQEVAFTAWVSPALPTPPITYIWGFGDGNAGSGEEVLHAFAAAGTYTVTVTAENGCGQAAAAGVVTVVYRIYLPLVAR